MHLYRHATRYYISKNGNGEDNNNDADHAITGFPNVTGAIDCAHIAIKSPF